MGFFKSLNELMPIPEKMVNMEGKEMFKKS